MTTKTKVEKGLNAINKIINKELGNDKKSTSKRVEPKLEAALNVAAKKLDTRRKNTVEKGKAKAAPKPRKESAVLKRIQNDYDYCVASTHDLRAEKKGYRVDLKPCFNFPSNGKEVKHYVAEDGLVTMLQSMREIKDCFCAACQKTVTFKRPTTYTKETLIRVQTSGGYILPKGGFEKRPLEYVAVYELPDMIHGAVWVDYNTADAAKINKVIGDKVFDVE